MEIFTRCRKWWDFNRKIFIWNKIDLGAGEDTLVLKHANESDEKHEKTEENTLTTM